jgi:hypothetical protein
VIAVRIDPGGAPAVVELAEGAYRYLAATFPDSFDGIRLAPNVIGYVGDCSLLDGSVPNEAGQALADAVYRRHAGRAYHTDVRGPMVILGVGRTGDSTSVPPSFAADFLPQLTRDLTAAGAR